MYKFVISLYYNLAQILLTLTFAIYNNNFPYFH